MRFLLLFVMVFAGVARADDLKDANAALRYWAAWSAMPKPYSEPDRALSELAEGVANAGWELDEAELDLVDDYREQLVAIGRATRLEYCDFELEFELAPKLLLPHVGRARTTIKLMLVEARLAMDRGDRAVASEWIGAAIRHTAHTGSDGTMVSSVAAMRNFEMIAALIVFMDESITLSAAEAATIRFAIEKIDQTDLFGARAALEYEGDRMCDWVARKSETPEGLKEIFDFLDSMSTVGGDRILDVGRVGLGMEVMKSGGWNSAVDGMRRAYGDLLVAWDGDDPIMGLRRVRDNLMEGDYGPVTRYLLPAISRLYQSQVNAKKTLRELDVLLDDAE